MLDCCKWHDCLELHECHGCCVMNARVSGCHECWSVIGGMIVASYMSVMSVVSRGLECHKWHDCLEVHECCVTSGMSAGVS